jgi:large subunit ribosomal protein L4e
MLYIYSLDGKVKEKIEKPQLLLSPYRPDLIKRAVKAILANKRKPYGTSQYAGTRHVARWIGKGRGMSRVPRLADGTGSFAPGTVGGRRAHPPKAEKIWKEKINKKEKRKALLSALAATSLKELVEGRGHEFDSNLTLPVILEDKFENLTSTKKVIEVLQKLNVYQDVLRAKNKTKIRAGVGKRRNRKYKVPRSLLLVVNSLENIKRAAGNLPGVDLATPKSLNSELLAPGGVAGRLTLFTQKAFQEVITKFG